MLEAHPVDDLVVIADFGEPIYPGLRRLGSVNRGGDKPAHVNRRSLRGERPHGHCSIGVGQPQGVDCVGSRLVLSVRWAQLRAIAVWTRPFR